MLKAMTSLAIIFFCLPIVATGAVIHVPSEQPTIQAGIDAAVDGDTVLVAAGTYVETIDFLGKAITVRSESSADLTIIDGNQNGSVVTFASGEGSASVLEGFTIQNGTGTVVGEYEYGGGIYCDQTSPTIRDCLITANIAGFGGGLHATGSSSTFDSCEFCENFALYADGYYEDGEGGGIRAIDSDLTVTDCSFMQNHGGGWGGASVSGGGGIYAIDSDLVVTSCAFSNNEAGESESNCSGGGIRCISSSPTISSCSFSSNRADYGGGIACSGGSPVISDCSFQSNVAIGSGWTENWGDGGGVFVVGTSNAVIKESTFSDNRSVNGGGIGCLGGSSLLITDCSIVSNRATSGWYEGFDGGGGISFFGASATVTNCLIAQNEARENFDDQQPVGGGIKFHSSSVLLTNITIADNFVNGVGEGGGLYIEDSAPVLTNVIVYGNTAPVGDGMYITGTGVPLVTYSDIQDGYEGEGNIDADPLFTTGSEGDYYLSQVEAGQVADSPCVNAGSTWAIVLGMNSSWTRTDEVPDSGQVDLGYHYGLPGEPGTVSADLSCVPGSGVLPFTSLMTISLTNEFTGQARRIAGRIEVTFANSTFIFNWRGGFTSIASDESFATSWNQNIPNLGPLVGDNVFTVVAEDVTPAPWNQPPYPPAGNTDTATCTVTGVAP